MTLPLDRRALLTGMCQHCKHWFGRYKDGTIAPRAGCCAIQGGYITPAPVMTTPDFVCAYYEQEPPHVAPQPVND